jgi:hypothetical protein
VASAVTMLRFAVIKNPGAFLGRHRRYGVMGDKADESGERAACGNDHIWSFRRAHLGDVRGPSFRLLSFRGPRANLYADGHPDGHAHCHTDEHPSSASTAD